MGDAQKLIHKIDIFMAANVEKWESGKFRRINDSHEIRRKILSDFF